MNATHKLSHGLQQVLRALARGFFDITHSSIALIGLTVIFAVITLTARPEIRQATEVQLMGWLQEHQATLNGFVSSVGAVERATAADPRDLPKQQAALAYWLSRKYSIAPEPLSVLVAAAFESGQRARLDPALILAVMAVESGFNPFAQSTVGAQGLMQVMTKVHSDKYQDFGGQLAAFDPVSNLRVGVQVLQECISHAGSIEGGLHCYVGASSSEDDGGYALKVMAEFARLQLVAAGKSVAFLAPMPVAPAAQPAKALPDTETVASAANS